MAKKKSQPGEPKQDLPRLMELAMTRKAPMVGGIILSVLATVASFVPYLAIYFVIREIAGVYPDFSALNVNAAPGYGALALGGVLLNVLLYTVSAVLSHIAAYGTLYETKISFVSHITKLPLGYHLNTGSGKLRKIMDDNIESLEGFIAHDLPNMISACASPVVMLVLLFAVDWRFGLATLAGIIVAFVLYGAASGGSTTQQLMTDYQASLENMSNASVEYIRGISVVKAFRQTAFSFKRLYDSIKNYTATVIPYSLSQELMTATLTAALNAIYLFLIPAGILIGSHTQNLHKSSRSGYNMDEKWLEQMRKPAIRCSTMPVFHTCRNDYYTSRMKFLRLFSPLLIIPAPGSTKKNLSPSFTGMMDMPHSFRQSGIH